MRGSIFFGIFAAMFLHVATHDAFGQSGKSRVWKDASGKFEIRAVLTEQTPSTVHLRTDDGRDLKVPIQRLSKADQDYLQSLQMPTDNPFASPAPASPATGSLPAAAMLTGTLGAAVESKSVGEDMALPGTGTTLDLASNPPKQPIVPDAKREEPLFPAAVVPVSPVDAYDKVSGPVLFDRAAGGFLLSIGRNKSGSPQETRGRIYSVNLTQKVSKLVWDFPNAVSVLGHDAASERTLIIDKLDQFQRGGELVMVHGLASGNAKPLYRRSLPGAGKPGFAPQVEWAKLLSGSHVAAIIDRALHVWDLPAAKLLYRVEDVSASEPPAFSGNLLYMAIPQSGKVTLIETATGTVRGSFATGSTLRPGTAFHPEGRLLALCFSNQYQVWDCVADTVVSEATTTDHLGSHPINWIAPNMFRSQLGDAVHLDLAMSVWKYNTSASTVPIVVGNKLIAVTTSQNCALVSVEIPHASTEKSVRQLTRAGDDALLIRPGSSVAIAVEAAAGGVEQAEIQNALSAAAGKAGWKVSDRASITLVAKIGRGKTEQLHFRNLGGAGARTESTASITPFTAELEIRRGATVLWTRSTVNRLPSILRLEEGETVQDAVKRYEKPDAAFFSRLTLPPRIPKPEISAQIGRSVLTDGQWRDLNVNASAGRKKSK